MNSETLRILKRSFLVMIIWVILGDLFALLFFNFHLQEASSFFGYPFGGLTAAVLVLAFREIPNGLIWTFVVLAWVMVLLLPAISQGFRTHAVATVRFQGTFSFLQFLFSVIGIVGSSC